VVIAYDRTDSLARLLESLSRARYPADVDVPLVISIDYAPHADTASMAERFDWPHGEKRIIAHPANLGLRAHVLACGDLAVEYGAAVLFEDDLVAAPYFYDWVSRTAEFYADDSRVAGIGLYSYKLNEFNNLNFVPISDGSDVHFLQVAASWGQAWTAAQWSAFRAWYDVHKAEPIQQSDGVPEQLEAWKDSSWKKYYIKYLTVTDRFFVYPNVAQSTNTAKPGTHTKRPVNLYQVPLDMGPRDWSLRALDDSAALYDVFYEMRPEALRRLCPWLEGFDFDIDLMGLKPATALRRAHLISSRDCRQPEHQWALEMIPIEANIAFSVDGDFISLGRREAFAPMSEARRLAVIRHLNLFAYWNKYFFQLFKPIQTRLQIARQALSGRKV
jgi:hypothetical protein